MSLACRRWEAREGGLNWDWDVGRTEFYMQVL